MNVKKNWFALKWNLMLLAGRPLAFTGLLWVGYGVLTVTIHLVPIGFFLMVIGFVIGWTGKIGKSLFDA